MRCPRTVPHEWMFECEECSGRGTSHCIHCNRGGDCSYCHGKGERRRLTTEHPKDCELCSGSGVLREDLSDWVRATALRSIRRPEERAFFRLSSEELLIAPPRVRDEKTIIFQVEPRASDLVEELLPRARRECGPTDEAGVWFELPAYRTSPIDAIDIAERLEEIREEESDAAA